MSCASMTARWTPTAVAALARDEDTEPPPRPIATLDDPAIRAAWKLRYGWNKDAPPLARPTPRPRSARSRSSRRQGHQAMDVEGPMDGISETTWPGVYNRSRLPGRDDYFPLPDWNVYVDGGKALTLDPARRAHQPPGNPGPGLRRPLLVGQGGRQGRYERRNARQGPAAHGHHPGPAAEGRRPDLHQRRPGDPDPGDLGL